MAVDFNVNVNVKTSGEEKLDKLEQQIKSLESNPVNIKVDVDSSIKTNGIKSKLQNTINQATKGIKISGFQFDHVSFAKEKLKMEKEISEISKSMKKSVPDITDSQSGKWASQYVTKRNQEYTKILNAEKKFQQEFTNIRKNVYQSIGEKSDVQKQMSVYYKELEVEAQRQAKQYVKEVSRIQSDLFNGKYDAKYSSMTAGLNRYSGQNNNTLLQSAQKQANIYKDTIDKLQRHFNTSDSFKLNDEQVIASFKSMNNAAEKFNNTMTQLRNTGSKSLAAGVAERSANDVKKYMSENTKAVKKYGDALRSLEKQYQGIKTVAEKADLDNQFKNLKSTISAEGLSGRSWMHEFSQGLQRIGQFAYSYGIVQRIPETLSAMANAVLDVDTAMTELRKVSTASESEISGYFNRATESAKKYGLSIDEIISSTADWSRLGYNLKDAEIMSEATALLTTVGDNMTQESSSEGLISILKGFQMEAEEANSIVSRINEVANTQPIDTSGIVDALQRSASSLSAANNTIDESIAMITAAKYYWLYVQKCA